MNKVFTPNRDLLECLYSVEQKTMKEISLELHIAQGKVFRLIHAYGIPTREKHTGFKGKYHSDTAKMNISCAHRGKHLSDSTKKKISKSREGLVLRPSEYGGHTKFHRGGYILVYKPSHPYAHKDGYVFEHILAYERAHNCFVDRKRFVVHHINENKTDNRPENLVLMTASEHMSYHSTQRHKIKRERGNNKWLIKYGS